MKTDDGVEHERIKRREERKKELKLLSEIGEFRRWQNQTRSSIIPKDGLKRSIFYVSRVSSSVGFSEKDRKCAEEICRKASSVGLFSGRQSEAIAAASVYAVCRLQQIPRSLSEVSRLTQVELSLLGHCYRIIVSGLNLDIPIPDISKYIERICLTLDLDQSTCIKAIEILDSAVERNLVSGKDPWGMAASIIYIASLSTKSRVSQKSLASVAGVSEITIRTRYKELQSKLGM